MYAAYSQDMIDDIDNFAAQINQRLINELMVVYDQKLYNGGGTDEFYGLTQYAQDFAVADNSLKTTTPNLRDVLNAACAQVEANAGNPTSYCLTLSITGL